MVLLLLLLFSIVFNIAHNIKVNKNPGHTVSMHEMNRTTAEHIGNRIIIIIIINILMKPHIHTHSLSHTYAKHHTNDSMVLGDRSVI